MYDTYSLQLQLQKSFFLFQMSRTGVDQQQQQQLQPDRQLVKQEGSSTSGSSCSYSPQGDDLTGRPSHVYSAPSGHYRHYASPPPPPHQYGASGPPQLSGACALEGCVRYAAGHRMYCSEECGLVAGDCKEEDEEEYSSSNSWPSCMVRPDSASAATSDLLVK